MFRFNWLFFWRKICPRCKDHKRIHVIHYFGKGLLKCSACSNCVEIEAIA